MDEKLTLQELIELLAKKHDMEQEDADAFVRMFFRLIEEALEVDKYVKIKGLGTFKLIEQQGGARISFTPDTTMRELINKPFSHFETVVLNDDTHFEGMNEEENVSVLSSEMEESLEEAEVSDSSHTVGAMEEKSTSEASPSSGSTDRPEEPTPLSKDEDMPTPEFQPLPSQEKTMPAGDIPPASTYPATDARKTFGFPWCMLASILLVGVVVGGGMVWNFFSHKRYVSDSVLDSLIYQRLNEKVLIEMSDSEKDSFAVLSVPAPQSNVSGGSQPLHPVDTLSGKQSEIAPSPLSETAKTSALSSKPSAVDKKESKASQTSKKETLSDTVEYQITGTQTTYTLRSGESLVKVAQKFYGNKKLWPYLVKHNKKVIKNADRIPVGATIEIPVLTPKRK